MTDLPSLLLKILTGMVSLLSAGFVMWATWATVAIFTIQSDIRVLKVANHLAIEMPKPKERREPVLAEPDVASGLLKGVKK